jgi:hypothetical protein
VSATPHLTLFAEASPCFFSLSYPVFRAASSIYYLQPARHIRITSTSTLLIELTYLPLSIVQAAAYINENGITLTEYLLLLEEQEEEVIDLLSKEFQDSGRYCNVKNPVAIT